MNLIAFFMRSVSLQKIKKAEWKTRLMQSTQRVVRLCEEMLDKTKQFSPCQEKGQRWNDVNTINLPKEIKSICSNINSNQVKVLKATSHSLICQDILKYSLYIGMPTQTSHRVWTQLASSCLAITPILIHYIWYFYSLELSSPTFLVI